jgi:hypothetical protein
MKYKTVPLTILIDEAFSDLQLDAEERNLSILKRQSSDILREFSTTEQLVHKIQLLYTDRQGKVQTPDDFKKIDHIGYRIKKDKNDYTSREKVVEWVQKAYNCAGEGDFEVKIDFSGDECVGEGCASLPVKIDVDFAFEKSNPQYYSQTKFGAAHNITDKINNNRSYLSDKFTLLEYKGNSFFRLQYHLDENCENLHCLDCKYGYSIELPYILTDLPQDTEILLSYQAELTDENGDLLCPDQVDAVEAIKEGILAKHFRVRFLETGDKKYMFFYQDAENKYLAAIGRAKSVLGSPINQELRTFLSDVWMKRIRNTSSVGTVMGRDPYKKHLSL